MGRTQRPPLQGLRLRAALEGPRRNRAWLPLSTHPLPSLLPSHPSSWLLAVLPTSPSNSVTKTFIPESSPGTQTRTNRSPFVATLMPRPAVGSGEGVTEFFLREDPYLCPPTSQAPRLCRQCQRGHSPTVLGGSLGEAALPRLSPPDALPHQHSANPVAGGLAQGGAHTACSRREGL